MNDIVSRALVEARVEDSGTHQLVISSKGPLDESVVEKVKKVVSAKSKNTEEMSRTEQIEQFLTNHKKLQMNDIPVKDMRHIIPVFLMEIHVEKYGHFTKKVKGLWEKRPDGWPAYVPFVDPNNKLKNTDEKNCKPKKELLGQMLTYLIEQYKAKKEEARLVSDTDFALESVARSDSVANEMFFINLLETDELLEAEQIITGYNQMSGVPVGDLLSSGFSDVHHSVNDGSISLDVAPTSRVDDGSLSVLEEPLCGVFGLGDGLFGGSGIPELDSVCLNTSPEQVMDSEEAHFHEDWDPLKELQDRIRKKYGILKKNKLLSEEFRVLLDSVYGKFENVTKMPEEEDQTKTIEWLHSFERILDLAKFNKSSDGIEGLRDLSNRLATCEQTEKVTEAVAAKLAEAMPHSGRTVEVPVTAGIPSVMKTLNIRTRQMPPTVNSTTATFNNLHLRISEPSPPLPVSLSENRKPVQPTVEDSAQLNAWQQHTKSTECMESMGKLVGLEQSAEQMQEVSQQPAKLPECVELMGDLSHDLMTLEKELNLFAEPEEAYMARFLDAWERMNDTGPTQTENAFPEARFNSEQEQCHVSSFVAAQPETREPDQVQKDFTTPDATLSMPVQETSIKAQAMLFVDPKNPTNIFRVVMNSVKPDNMPHVFAQSQPIWNQTSYPSVFSPNTADAEECFNRLSLQASSPAPAKPVQNTTSQVPPGPKLINHQSSRPSVGKRTYPFENDKSRDFVAASTPPQTGGYSALIPTMVEEMSDDVFRPKPRFPKKKPRTIT